MPKQWKKTVVRQDGISVSAMEEISQPENQEEIASLAYEFWQARGCPEGTSEEDWLRAEREIASKGTAQAGKSAQAGK